MNIVVVIHFIGTFLKYLGLLMGLPLLCSLIYGEGDWVAFIIPIMIAIITGFILKRATKSDDEIELGPRECFAIVGFSWLIAAIIGSIPYMLAGTFEHFYDALFESMSGFTTTGATVLVNIEAQTHGILFWRDFTHWLGGMGIIVLAIAVLPALNVGGMRLLSAESPGPTAEKLKPRITSTAKSLWVVYIILSAAEVIFLMLAGMPLFESLCHMFGTMGTGGFSTKAASIGAYNSPLIEGIIVVFMFLAGANFVLHYYSLRGDFSKALKNSEFRFYCMVIGVCIVLVTLNIWKSVYDGFFSSIRYAVFQVVSITTTTGYTTANFDAWPSFSRGLLLMLMFVGGCAGSTGGAMKNIRVMIMLKKGYLELFHMIKPNAVLPVRVGKDPVSKQIVSEVMGFFLLYMLLFVLASLFMMFIGIELVTAITSVAATIGNIGPGLNMVGATQNYAWVPIPGKCVLTACMLLGRLELFTVLVLLVPAFWRE